MDLGNIRKMAKFMIRSVHHKFLRVPESHDYSGYNH